ncbi:MAG: Asp23/Gls24 family envelope stress response protein [Pseudoclavibacter sp.]
MNEHDTPDLPPLGLEPDDLDGHTIEELSDYLDAGRTPIDASIEQSPGCRIALDALERLRALTPDLIESDEEDEPEPNEGWVRNILENITLDARAGRRIPIVSEAKNADFGFTEGAIRGVIRAAETSVPGVVIGRCRLEGDVTVPDAPIRIRVDVSVPYGEPIPGMVDSLRAEIGAALESHSTLNVTAVDITVHDIHELPNPAGGER